MFSPKQIAFIPADQARLDRLEAYVENLTKWMPYMSQQLTDLTSALTRLTAVNNALVAALKADDDKLAASAAVVDETPQMASLAQQANAAADASVAILQAHGADVSGLSSS